MKCLTNIFAKFPPAKITTFTVSLINILCLNDHGMEEMANFMFQYPGLLHLSNLHQLHLDAGLDTFSFSNSQTSASRFNLNSQIAVSNSQLVFCSYFRD